MSTREVRRPKAAPVPIVPDGASSDAVTVRPKEAPSANSLAPTPAPEFSGTLFTPDEPQPVGPPARAVAQPIAPPTPRTRVTATICGRTEVGPTRAQNQDAIMVAHAVTAATGARLAWSGVVPEAGVSAVVVDGMGGDAGGEDAAALTAMSLAAADTGRDAAGWDAWFTALSARIAKAGAAWDTPDMGAAVALLVIAPDGLLVANVGDCRIYRVVGRHLGQVSVDDRTGEPGSTALTQALGGFEAVTAHTWRQPYQDGVERFVLCSDGVWGTLDPAALRDLCVAPRPPAQIADAVVASCYARNASDNCSVIVVDVEADFERRPAAPVAVPPPAWPSDVVMPQLEPEPPRQGLFRRRGRAPQTVQAVGAQPPEPPAPPLPHPRQAQPGWGVTIDTPPPEGRQNP
jgi:serine/threonine protein phosphatase PrpC